MKNKPKTVLKVLKGLTANNEEYTEIQYNNITFAETVSLVVNLVEKLSESSGIAYNEILQDLFQVEDVETTSTESN